MALLCKIFTFYNDLLHTRAHRFGAAADRLSARFNFVDTAVSDVLV